MDVGIGGIVFSSGLVSFRYFKSLQQHQKSMSDLILSFLSILRASLPIMLMGIARCLVVKSVNYQEHVSEYGVHWNFFLTLATIPIFTFFIGMMIPLRLFGYSAIIISLGKTNNDDLMNVLALVYQIFLRADPSFQEFVLSDTRDPRSFVSLNKEGIFGLIGMIAIFLYACHVGSMIDCIGAGKTDKKNGSKRQRHFLLINFATLFTMYAICRFCFDFVPSRRLVLEV